MPFDVESILENVDLTTCHDLVPSYDAYEDILEAV